jgi:hypothetical protein
VAAAVRSALIVASDTYDDPGLGRLRAPAHDAQALSAVLGDARIGGFETYTLLNEPCHVISRAIEDFFSDRHPDDLLLLHISSHGIKDETGELHFATRDTSLRRLASTSVAADFVNRRMARSRSRRIVLLLDCCYAGAFERGMSPRAGAAVGVEEQLGGRGRAVITASSAMEYAFEGENLADSTDVTPSVFTTALVEGLASGEADQDEDGRVGLDELYDYVYGRIREVTPNQTPSKWAFGLQGELYIARRARPVTTPTPLPRELQQVLDHPLAGVRGGAVEELSRLLHGPHAGLALAARLALERLCDDDSRAVSALASEALTYRQVTPDEATAPAEQTTRVPISVEDQAGEPLPVTDRASGDGRDPEPAPPDTLPLVAAPCAATTPDTSAKLSPGTPTSATSDAAPETMGTTPTHDPESPPEPPPELRFYSEQTRSPPVTREVTGHGWQRLPALPTAGIGALVLIAAVLALTGPFGGGDDGGPATPAGEIETGDGQTTGENGEAAGGGDIIFGTTDTVVTLDPAKAYDFASSNILFNVGETRRCWPRTGRSPRTG